MPELSIRLLALSALLAASAASHAADKLILQTTWVAQAEQGGYYQAIAAGIYKKYALMSRSAPAGRSSII